MVVALQIIGLEWTGKTHNISDTGHQRDFGTKITSMSKSRRRKKHPDSKRFILCKVYITNWKDVYLLDKKTDRYKHIGSKTATYFASDNSWKKNDKINHNYWIPLTKSEVASVGYWRPSEEWYIDGQA